MKNISLVKCLWRPKGLSFTFNYTNVFQHSMKSQNNDFKPYIYIL